MLTGEDIKEFSDGNLLQGVGEYTWPGVELGHRPIPTHTFFEVSTEFST